MDAIKISHNDTQAVVTGGMFHDMLKAVKGSFKSQRAWFNDDKKMWIMPGGVDFDYIQERIEKRGFRVVASVEDARRVEQLARQAADRKAQAEREARWERERRERAVEREMQNKARSRAITERVQVEVGQYAVGDILGGKVITGFGQAWVITEPGTWGQHGRRYDETCDGCHQYASEIDNDTGLCEKCGADGKQTTVCYAYFD